MNQGSRFGQPPRTGQGVLRQAAFCARKNVGGNSIPFFPGREDFDSQRGNAGLVSGLRPRNEFIGFIDLEPLQQLLTQPGPNALMIEIENRRFKRAQTDFVAAAFVSQDVAPAADFGDLATDIPAIAAGTGATENQHAGGGHVAIFLRSRG